jgi:hypothetical protein
MTISCDCGAFEAKLTEFPNNTPGRLACYCKDCQAYLNKIGRSDVLDEFGGTEVIPAYPKDVELVKGTENLKCSRLSPNGLHRWSTTCCNSPIGNTRPGFPWVGFYHSAYKAKDPNALNSLGDIRSRIFGRDAKAGAPFEISNKISFKAMLAVTPFIIKGKIKKMSESSPFYEADGKTPIREPELLPRSEDTML